MQENRRVEWIDAARGIGIILAMLIHTATSSIRENDIGVFILYQFTITATMPVMMFLSGCSVSLSRSRYSQMNFKDFVKKKSKSFLLPYLCYATIVYLIFELTSRLPVIGTVMSRVGYGGMHPVHFLIGLLIGQNEYSVHVWFLYSLFVYEIISYLVFKYSKNNIPLYVLAVLFYLCQFIFNLSFSLAYLDGTGYLIYFAFGVFFTDRIVNKKLGISTTVSWIILFLAFMFLIRWYTLPYEIIKILIPLCACMAITFWSQNISGRCSEVLQWLGKRSMTLYLFQQPFFGSALGTLLYGVLGFPAWPTVFISFVLSITMPLLIRQIFVRYKWFRTMFSIK
ncbi:acyltransferase family protein [Butyrivibrio sp. XPD2006]|uniref:acyltransferase family protein n=1 Tax=Butyrivibrio sp. XPD2006 TaxID=1280668 RepID=UPI0003B6FA1B|nr:acyltransferase [Butyrivibrio sp. XPD2006]